MNERIKELYIQTSNETADGKEWAIGGLLNAERFAELIIQECLNICEEMGDNGMDGHYCADKIAKTFQR